jgi:acetyl-CoA C-acetyltransferase
MARRVGVVSVHQTEFLRENVKQSNVEMSWEVVKKCLQDTGLKFASDGTGIDHQVMVSNDFWDGQTLSDIKYHDVMGGMHRDVTRVTQDGAEAIMYSVAAIQSNHVDVVMIMGICKESMVSSRNAIGNFSFEPIFDRAIGMDCRVAAAFQARAYMEKYGISREQAAKVVVKNTENAVKNPAFPDAKAISLEEVLSAKMLADPIGTLEEYPVTDGAVCMVLAAEEKAKELCANPVWINGFGTCRDTYELGRRDLSWCAALESAAQRAYKTAGISDPVKEIDLFQITEEYAFQELLWSEGLGLCAKGEGGKLIDSGATAPGGSLPINPSGGVIAGVPELVKGLNRFAEAYYQLQGKAGACQVENAKTALAHGLCGPAGQLHTVLVLGAN